MKFNLFLSTFFACSAFIAPMASAQELPGAYTELCQTELASGGAETYAVFDGSWSGLPQTALFPAVVLDMQPLEEPVLIFAATPSKPEWNVEAGCTTYEATFDGETFSVTSGQRTDESVTYRFLESGDLRGDLSSPGVENFAIMARAPSMIQVGE